MSETFPTHAQAVVIGGGIAGCNMAYHLAKLGWRDVVVVEKQKLSSGTTWHSAGNVTRLVSSLSTMRHYKYAGELYSSLEAETGQATGWRRCGRVMMARTPERISELKRMKSMGKLLGIPVEEISPKEVGEKLPIMRTEDLVGAIWSPSDGRVNPTDALMALVKGARARGVRFVEDTAVTGIARRDGRVTGVETSNGPIATEIVVNAAGLWSRRIATGAGVDAPLYAAEHFYILTKPMGMPADMPTFRDPDGLIYGREDVGGLLVGAFDIGAKALPVERIPEKFAFSLLNEDWDQFEPYMKTAIHRIPALETAQIRMLLNGPESFTPDGDPLVGEAPGLKGFYLFCGFNSGGVTYSPGTSRALAERIVEGKTDTDLAHLDPRRFGPCHATEGFLKARVTEMPSFHFFVHEAGHEFKTGRDLRLSPVHTAFAARKSLFGASFGWERPKYLGENGATMTDAIAAECTAARERAALFDRSSLAKILVQGGDAGAYLDSLSLRPLDMAPGEARPTAFLNGRGGVEALPVVVRLTDGDFLVLAEAESGDHVIDWLKRNVPATRHVAVTDVSNAYAALGLRGPATDGILAGAGASAIEGTAPLVELGYARGRAVSGAFGNDRLILVESEFAANVYEAILEAGAKSGMAHAGWFASEALRLFDGRPAWGIDTGAATDARATFGAVAVKGSRNFMGLGAMRTAGAPRLVRRCLILKGNPRPQGSEPILGAGKLVGATTSGAQIPWLGRTIVMGHVPAKGAGASSVEIEAQIYAAEIHATGR
ncbi:MAG: FAD-dependent oxidoreductase [Alphaproteobacteria bacterium]